MGDIGRFVNVGDYFSYCRCVESERPSNGKMKGENNKKNGNNYLAWAYVEAAQFAGRYWVKAQRFYQSKAAKTWPIVTFKALSNKLLRASYYILDLVWHMPLVHKGLANTHKICNPSTVNPKVKFFTEGVFSLFACPPSFWRDTPFNGSPLFYFHAPRFEANGIFEEDHGSPF